MLVDGVHPGLGAGGVGQAQVPAPLLQRRQLAPGLGLEGLARSVVATGVRIKGAQPRHDLRRLRRGLAAGDAQRLEPAPHRLGGTAAGEAAQRRMLAERRRQVAQHRIGVAGHRHEVRRRRALGDARRELAQGTGRDAHVERRAHVEAHRQAVQPGHHHVLETHALELIGARKHFRADESRHVVDDRPHRRRLADATRHAVGARLQRAHVDALGGAVGDLGALAGLEVEAAERARQVGDAVHVQAHHPGEGPRRAGQALKADVHDGVALRRVLLDQIGEHAEARRQLEPPHHLLEQLLQPDDGVEIVGGRIEADDDVAAAVRQAFEDRQQDLALVVAGAVGLNA